MQNLSSQSSVSLKKHSEFESPFSRKIPTYLDPKSLYKDLAQEKRVYIEFVKSLLRKIDFSSGKRIAVFGVGRGLESQVIAEVLDNRQAKGEDFLADIKLESVEISSVILQSLRESALSERVKLGLINANLLNIPKDIFPNNSYALITISSLLHEIQSEDGWQGAITVINEAKRMLAPGGYLIIRDFYVPTCARQTIMLKTQLAKNFFKNFSLNFQHKKRGDWQKEFLLKNGNHVEASSAFAFELLLHFRMFYKNYYKILGEMVFDFFTEWQELIESYSLNPNHSVSDVPGIMKLSGITPNNSYACAYFFCPDSEDDKFLAKHFSCFQLNKVGVKTKSDLFPTKRLTIILHKLPSKIKGKESSDMELKKFLSKLTDETINIT